MTCGRISGGGVGGGGVADLSWTGGEVGSDSKAEDEPFFPPPYTGMVGGG